MTDLNLAELRALMERATASNRFQPMSVMHDFTHDEFAYFRALRDAALELLAMAERCRELERENNELRELLDRSEG
jgi:hypothetical protein